MSNPAPVLRQKVEGSGRALKGMFGLGTCFPAPKAPIRRVVPNHRFDASTPRYEHPNRTRYADNRIKTTKYCIWTFLPKNLFEQFHRFANLYFLMIVILNWVPQIQAFGRYLSMIPITFVLTFTAAKDAFEDYRRYKSDRKINHSTCRVWDSLQNRYRKLEWQNILVGDFVHLSSKEVIPADILLLRSSDPQGICFVETSNLDGESNLKQRHAVHTVDQMEDFRPPDFMATVECEAPNNQIYRFSGVLINETGRREPVNKENLLLRGCEVRNTDYVEGIVLYAGKDTKAMLNNSGPRYKRSLLERLVNRDIIWCVLILVALCLAGALMSAVWLESFQIPLDAPFFVFDADSNLTMQAFLNFWTYIIILQVMIPISLYVSIELIKLGQVFLISQDLNLYHEEKDKRIQCRALNIPEELGQIKYLLSDKTGTLTENQMIFRRCSVIGCDYGGDEECAMPVVTTKKMSHAEPIQQVDVRLKKRIDEVLNDPVESADSADLLHFFTNLALCNTVVVNAEEHQDLLDEYGFLMGNTYKVSNAVFHLPSPLPKLNRGWSQNEEIIGVYEEYEESEEDVLDEAEPELEPALTDTEPTPEDSTFEETLEITAVEIVDEGTGTPLEERHPSMTRTLADASRNLAQMASNSLTHLHLPKLPHLPKVSRLRVKGLSPLLRFRRSSKRSAYYEDTAIADPIYEAESPDELALIHAARAYGFRLAQRRIGSSLVLLHSKAPRLKRYQVLDILQFDPERKRMSVIVKTGHELILYCKGADSTVMPVIDEKFRNSQRGGRLLHAANNHLSLYASEGLRTLCLAMKHMTEDEYRSWKAKWAHAETHLERRDELLMEAAIDLEKDLQLLGVTAIEDRLQDGVPETIYSLRQADIRVWVLTGDKLETAVNIAYASRLFSPEMQLVQLSAGTAADTAEVLVQLLAAEDVRHRRGGSAATRGSAPLLLPSVAMSGRVGLVVSGHTLAFCLQPEVQPRFMQMLQRCDSVLCCRSTPLQKAQVVKLAKSLGGRVLAIGDGANDVPMIQAADVGVGITGQEGMQAVMASDFAIPRFRFLTQLLLVHGHWAYYRLAMVVLYFLYKNAAMVFMVFMFQLYDGFSSQVPIDPIYLMVYNFLFSSVPCLLYGITEQDVPAETLRNEPALYSQGSDSKLYRFYSFWINMLDALWQASCIFYIAYFTFIGTDCELWKFGMLLCAQLLVVNSLHLALLVQLWTVPLALSLILSVCAFFVFALLYNALVSPAWPFAPKDAPVMMAERTLIDLRFWLALAVTVVAALLPRFIAQVLASTLWPSDVLRARIRSAAEKPEKPWNVRWSRGQRDSIQICMPVRGNGQHHHHNENQAPVLC